MKAINIIYNMNEKRIYNGDTLLGSVDGLHNTILNLFKKYGNTNWNGWSWVNIPNRIIEALPKKGKKRKLLKSVQKLVNVKKLAATQSAFAIAVKELHKHGKLQPTCDVQELSDTRGDEILRIWWKDKCIDIWTYYYESIDEMEYMVIHADNKDNLNEQERFDFLMDFITL